MEIKNVSVIIPARNEELYLQNCIDSINAAAAFFNLNAEIIVVINRCTDSTSQIAELNKCKVVDCDDKNLSMIRNRGVKSSSYNYIMTVDADSIVSKNIFKEVLRLLNSEKYVGGGVVIFPERYSLGILISGFILAWIALVFRIQCGAFFFKREYFDAIDGFNENIFSAEDIDFAIRLKRFGKSIDKKYSFINLAHITTSCRKFDHFGDWYFIKNYRETYRLLRGQGKDAADKIWYDFKR